MNMKTEILAKRAEIGDDLLTSLVKGLEDIKAGRVTPWKFRARF